jgi:hypothetical protein
MVPPSISSPCLHFQDYSYTGQSFNTRIKFRAAQALE